MILTVLLLTLVSSSLAEPADKNAQQRSPRAPQGQIRYSDPDGSKVDWKLYTPQNRGQIDSGSSRRQRAETGTGQANFSPHKQQVAQAPIEHQPQYQPYSAVPSHIKQLIVQAYSPQGPYVDPGAFFYQAPAISPISSASPQQKQDQNFPQTSDHSYFNSAVNYRAAGYEQTAQASSGPGKLGGIKYADEDRVYQRSAELPYGSVLPTQSQTKRQYQPYKQIQVTQSQLQTPQPQYQRYNQQFSQPQHQPNKQISQSQYQQSSKQISQPQYQPQYQQFNKQVPQSQLRYPQLGRQSQQIPQPQPIKPVSQAHFEKNMPTAIQTLLNYQAQLPYNVIANHILYRPKQLFIPKPLPEDAKYAGQYPSKVYFVKVDGDVYDGPLTTEGAKTDKRY